MPSCSARGIRTKPRAPGAGRPETAAPVNWRTRSTEGGRVSGSASPAEGEAIHEFEGSELLRRAFGDHIFNNYARLKRQEWDEYRVQLTQWEHDRYLSVL